MAPSTITLEVTNDHAVPVEPSLGGSVTVVNVSGDILYYADTPQVLASNSQGSLTAGQSATFSPPVWLRSAGLSTATATVSDPSSFVVAGGNPLNATRTFFAALAPYNVKADGRTLTDASITAGGRVSSPSYQFTGQDIGKLAVYVYGASSTTHLYTTISGVIGGQAQLAASGIATGPGEFVFASDDTAAAQACITAAAALGGMAEFPEGDIGLSAALNTPNSLAVTVTGQSVKELYGVGTTNSYGLPTVAPYLKGTVFVQFSAATDILHLGATGVTQNVTRIGLRFAGRYSNTGHGLNDTSINNPGLVSGVIEDVRVFGHDGNHYAFVFTTPALCRLTGLRSYGGGGVHLNNGASADSPGNLTCSDWWINVYIGGSAHGIFMDGGGGGGNFQYCLFLLCEVSVSTSNPAIPGTTQPTSAQWCLQHVNGGGMLAIGWVGTEFESNVGSQVAFPYGFQCYHVSYPAAATTASGLPASIVSKTAYQNQSGAVIVVDEEFTMTPTAAGSPSTTLSAGAALGAGTLTVTSATGFVVGQGVQIGDAGHDGGVLDFAIIDSIAGSVLTLIRSSSWGLAYAHSAGATVQAGCAIVHVETRNSNVWPGARVGRLALPITALPTVQQIRFTVPTGYWMRMTWANANQQWNVYSGTT